MKVNSELYITLDASQSYDPDKNQLSFKWWVMPEVGPYKKEINIPGGNASKKSLKTISGKNSILNGVKPIN